jgi:hypothetical protein
MKKHVPWFPSHFPHRREESILLSRKERQGEEYDQYTFSHSLQAREMFRHHQRLRRTLLWMILFLLSVLFVLLLLTRQQLALLADILLVFLFDRCLEALQSDTSCSQ